MAEQFRYSPNENRAHEIAWRHWSRDAFRAAVESDRPIFLCLMAVWCRACQQLDEGPLSDDRVIELVNERFVPVRVDADRNPHIQDRYIAGGWPTVALLTPTGEVFWSSAEVEVRELLRVGRGVLEAWHDERAELEAEIEQRRKAMEAARSRRAPTGLVRREAADDVLTGAQDQFDARNGGFGEAPKFIHAEAVELFLRQGERLPNPDWIAMAERTLDGMLAGEIEDARDGGFFHYALAADWTRPQVEKLLPLNARALSAFTIGADHMGRDDLRGAAERTVAWVDTALARDGLWVGSQFADPEYYGDDAGDRAPPGVDDTVYTHAAAMWIAALADAGRRLRCDAWVERASAALDTLLDTMAEPGDTLVHFRDRDAVAPTGLLLDLLHAARAAVAVADAAARPDALEHARRLVGTMKDTLWDDAGGFADHRAESEPLGALRYPSRPFEENALAARLHIALAERTGDRSYRAVAERVLAFLSPLAGRYAVEGATFAMAVEEFFDLRR
ncbi:MAG: DUF255 domain-containing protein [Gemmatimonadetes bacterium]|nr:thioredoxin domain-containing protein [Gemmatimonadota bacterium]NIQ58516.1 thioredoxin domain-containing protein [Gemmatimonadota bacterium]NIU78713.1 DUF255 domain-containing protein [Gammaproteobacteria bacterium]NIX47532.1 DUF255 domain-containing protein [Gemmatimonadota bacterium]NIY11902.1 DUF255 domain-containing protein [Gemmatimonadota bacterium]